VSRLPHSGQKRGGSSARLHPLQDTVVDPQLVQKAVDTAGASTASEDAGERADRHAQVGEHLEIGIG
jgi:hypothetical protein